MGDLSTWTIKEVQQMYHDGMTPLRIGRLLKLTPYEVACAIEWVKPEPEPKPEKVKAVKVKELKPPKPPKVKVPKEPKATVPKKPRGSYYVRNRKYANRPWVVEVRCGGIRTGLSRHDTKEEAEQERQRLSNEG